MSMVWKRTPAGDFAFNQCPMNATGKVGLIAHPNPNDDRHSRTECYICL